MNPALQLFVLLIIITIILEMAKKGLSNQRANQLSDLLMKQEFSDFYVLLDEKKTKLLLPPFNLNYFRLTAAFLEKNGRKVNECLESFKKMKLNEKQKEAVYSNAFSYYLENNNRIKTQQYLQVIKELSNSELINETNMLYDIHFNHNTKYLNQFLKKLETASNEEKSYLESMICKIYEMSGDQQKAKEYKEKAKDSYLKYNTK